MRHTYESNAERALDPRLLLQSCWSHLRTTADGACADAVANYLKSKGVVMGDRFFTQGFGDTKPIADNKTEEGRAQNRRATIHRTDCGPAN